MFKVNRAIKDRLQEIADKLPEVITDAIEYKVLSGKELLGRGVSKDLAGNKINRELLYKWPVPRKVKSDHYRILKRCFTEGGEKKVLKYIESIKEMPVVA